MCEAFHSHMEERIKHAIDGITTQTSETMRRYINARTDHVVEVGKRHIKHDYLRTKPLQCFCYIAS